MSAEPYNRTLGLLRNASVFVLVGLLAFLARPTMSGLALGLLVVALGESIRVWAAGHLIKTERLVLSGPYRFTRNPLYLGRLLIFTGVCLMARLPYGLHWAVLAAGYGVFFGYYLPRKERVEPTRLAEIHGESYERYRRAVPALIPSLRPYQASGSQRWSAQRMLDNREHWMILGLLALTLFLLSRL